MKLRDALASALNAVVGAALVVVVLAGVRIVGHLVRDHALDRRPHPGAPPPTPTATPVPVPLRADVWCVTGERRGEFVCVPVVDL